MNEEIESMISKLTKLVELWEDGTKCRANAVELQMHLSIMKLMLGIEKFDALPALVRVLKEVTDFIDADDKSKAEFAKSRNEIKDTISSMKEALA